MAVITKKTAILGVALIAGLVALVKFVWKPMQAEKTEAPKPVDQAMSEKKMAPLEQDMKTVSKTTSYKNPGGSDDVAFALTVNDKGVITEAKTEVLALNPASKMRQQAFAAELPSVLIGKELSSLSQVDRVGGSSLTTNAFNVSLAELKSQL